jgi:hypothetical protein
MKFNKKILKEKLPLQVDDLIEGNCWTLNCALFSYLSGDLHHGSAHYLIEGVRIALTKYAYKHKFQFFEDKNFAYVLNHQLRNLGFTINRGDYRSGYEPIDDEFLKYMPSIDPKYIKKDKAGRDKELIFTTVPYGFQKLGQLYTILHFLTEVSQIMSRTEVDPIGTFMFETLTKFKKYIKDKFKEIDEDTVIEYQRIFNEFLNENKKIKKQVMDYQITKMTSYFDVEVMLEIGENETIEFKEKVINKIYVPVIALSNTLGGKILIGISNDKKVVGLKNATNAKNNILNILHSHCKPSVRPYILPQEFRGKQILIIEVPKSKEIISTSENEIYIRKGSHNRKASISELKEMFEQTKDSKNKHIN